ncbi:MAG: SMEK domain-containing protein [Thermoflexales bacterium]
MKQQVILNRIVELLALFSEQVRLSNAAGFFDINRISESALIPVFRIVYGLEDLKNLNILKMNFPAVDLGDDVKKVSIQVTSTGDAEKVKETLTKFVAHGLESRFNKVLVFILTQKNPSYSKLPIQAATGGKIKFDPESDIHDFGDIAKYLQQLSLDDCEAVKQLLEDNFGAVNGDPIESIRRALVDETDRVLPRVNTRITVTDTTLQREEVAQVSAQIKPGHVVLLVGDPGTGKSGVAAQVAGQHIGRQMEIVVYLDARRFAACTDVISAGRNLGLNGSLADALMRLSRLHRVLLLIDQFDSAVGLGISKVLIDLVNNCVKYSNANVVVVSRKVTKYENDVIAELSPARRTLVECHLISSAESLAVLNKMGFLTPDPRLIQLGRNLLNLQLIGTIAARLIREGRVNILDEFDLWEQLRESLVDREAHPSEPERGEHLISEAIDRAKEGLKSVDGTFKIQYPPTLAQRRLISEQWIVAETRVIGRFAHEKMQDYLYAWQAAEQLMMPSDIARDISLNRARTILGLLTEMYKHRDAQLYQRFVAEAL